MVGLATDPVTRMGRLLGGEIALLRFGNCEERIGCGFSCAGHCTIIQSICIFVQVPTDFPRAVSVVVFVLPARTDTRWWHDYVIRCKLRFIRGRLRFGDGKNSAPFPSAIVILGKLNASINLHSNAESEKRRGREVTLHGHLGEVTKDRG